MLCYIKTVLPLEGKPGTGGVQGQNGYVATSPLTSCLLARVYACLSYLVSCTKLVGCLPYAGLVHQHLFVCRC